MYLEKPKSPVIWNGGSSLLKVGDLVWRIVNVYRIQSMTKAINILWGRSLMPTVSKEKNLADI